MADRPFVVVGAGLGGLATALRLAHRGERVIVLEKTDKVGGRNGEVEVGDCKFDSGPTLVMMLDPFRKLFADVGERLEDHLQLSLCDPSYRVFCADGTGIEATSDRERMAKCVELFAGRPDADGYRRLMADLEALDRVAIPNFVAKNFYRITDFMTPKALGLVAKHRMLANLARRIRRYVDDERLRMLFSFQTMYLGLSPYDAPWVYSVLTYMECGEGIWFPRGGVAEISQSIARLATAKGVDIRLSHPVARIDDNVVVLSNGERIEAHAVVCNADLPYAERELLNRPRKAARTYSCSAFMQYIDYDGTLPELRHHNVFFGADFKGNLESIFSKNVLPEDPAFYAAVSARTDETKAPPGHENLYLLTPCPNLDHPWSAASAEALQERTLSRLEREVGFDRTKIRAIKTYTPEDWATDLNLDKGAAFGLSHHFRQSAFFRPANRSKTNPCVYFAGASTVPGNGLPMVLISADLVVERLKHDGFLA